MTATTEVGPDTPDLPDRGPGHHIRAFYNVPAEIGTRVIALDDPGTIVGFHKQYLVVALDRCPDAKPEMFHPTYRIQYIAAVVPVENPWFAAQIEGTAL